MEHTQLINAIELENYASRRDSVAGVIPELLYFLVRQSAPDCTACRIPYGASINQPGLDGFVETVTGFREFVPRGRSYWEIGTGGEPQKKATDDFRKRTEKTTWEERQIATYVAVTAFGPGVDGWNEPSQREWISRRMDQGWKGIRILDAVKLADWLREFPAVGKWLLKQIGLVKSAAGFRTPAEHWENLQHLCKPELPAQLFMVGRDHARTQIEPLFRGQINQLVLAIDSEHDAEDFVAAFLASLEPETRREFGNHCLFISDPDVWVSMTSLTAAHVLVAHPNLDLESSGQQLLFEAKKRGHRVILSASSWGGEELLQLRSPPAASIAATLVEFGFPEERARELAEAGALSLAALKRHLLGLGTPPPYAKWDSSRLLALAQLIGRWSGENPADRSALEIALGKPYGEWIEVVRPEALRPDTPLIQRNENWKIISRVEAWSALGPRLTNEDLDRFQRAVLVILGEQDPKFELAPEDRFAAVVHNKALKHSSSLRKGVAEALALLGSRPSALSSCSDGKAESVAALTVRELLRDATWLTWASLDRYLPALAEAAPAEFMDAVEQALVDAASSPFKSVFSQESSSPMGSNYITGLLWGLETLAWNADYLIRASVLLAELASIDPGGNWANRPANSLADIFLPWHPQTCALIAKRRSAVEAILREQPGVGWKLLLALLPHSRGATSGTRKPAWRDFIPAGWSERVTGQEYWQQIINYTDLAVATASTDVAKLAELIARLPDLPSAALTRVLEHLGSESVLRLSETARAPLWEAVTDLVAKHRKYSNANWVMSAEILAQVESTAKKLAPKSPNVLHRRLFSGRDFDLFDEKGDYLEQERKLEALREAAVKEIFELGGLSAVLDFARQVTSPFRVGFAFASNAADSDDSMLLPSELGNTEKKAADFISGFVSSRAWKYGWEWVDQVSRSWAPQEKVRLLLLLPFEFETWRRAESLGEDTKTYWKTAVVNPWHLKNHGQEAVQKLLEYGRPSAALRCLYPMIHDKEAFATELASRALLSATAIEEAGDLPDRHNLVEIIKWLQERPDVDLPAIARIEWAYMALLDDEFGSPKFLERELASSPASFCQVLGLVFRSKNEPRAEEPATESEKTVAQNAFRLLRKWTTIPGQTEQGSLDVAAFSRWLVEVKRLTTESGHFGIAMSEVGRLFAHAPNDPSGLWIHRSIAEELNAKDADRMRSGFACELLNMRGVYYGTQGKEEREIAKGYREKADTLEQHGFHRIAATVRELATSYERQAVQEASEDIYEDL
jgi:hypothetical protein